MTPNNSTNSSSPNLDADKNNAASTSADTVQTQSPTRSSFKKFGWPIVLLTVVLLAVVGWQINKSSSHSSGSILTSKESVSLADFDFANADSVDNLSETTLSDEQKTAILTDGFVVRPYLKKFYRDDVAAEGSRSDDWTDIYGDLGGSMCEEESGNAVYVTADTALHIYHKLFDLELEYLEDTQFIPALKQLSEELLTAVLARATQSTNEDERASYERLSAYLAVPTALLRSVDVSAESYSNVPADYFTPQLDETKVNQNLAALTADFSPAAAHVATREMERILAANEVEVSGVTEQDHDYTQYTARGHYNKNALGQAYFKAMMWYGRNNFALSSTDPDLNVRKTLDALNLVNALAATENGLALWQSLKEPIDYLVGNADDLTVTDYQSFAKANLTLADVQTLLPQMQTLQKPQIMSAVIISPAVLTTSKEDLQAQTQSFQFFSQRFTPDAYIFTTLTQGDEAPNPETGEKLPSTPTALMVPTAFGNQWAADQLDNWIAANAPDSAKVLANKMKLLQDEFASWNESQWTKNNYVSWLYTLQSLKDGQAAGLMTENGTAAKNLNAFLGSYTELKHDTLLYAKQSYAEMGGGCEAPTTSAFGYVEPNREFWTRLQSLVQTNRDWLQNSGLVTEEDSIMWRLDNYLEELAFYQTVLTSQETATKMSDEEYEDLRLSVSSLGSITRPIFNVAQTEGDARAALIADVATDVFKGQIIYEANGIPDEIILAVDDFNGRRLVRGLTYSYREFTGSLSGTRETDQTWQAEVYQENADLPAQPDWWTPYFGK